MRPAHGLGKILPTESSTKRTDPTPAVLAPIKNRKNLRGTLFQN